MAYSEDDFVDPLMENQEAFGSEGAGEATGKVELPYSTLRQMQLDREDQSHQEACDKYSKVCIVWYGARGAQGEVCMSVCACGCGCVFGLFLLQTLKPVWISRYHTQGEGETAEVF